MSANEDPIGLDDEDEDLINVDGESEQGEVHGYPEESSEEAAKKWWMDQSWEQKWREVLKQLASGKARWDESGESRIAVLEDYKRQALLDKNPQQGTRPTVLHELAKDFEVGDFQDIPEDARLKVVKFLLQHVQRRAPTEGYDLQEDPILEVAMRCDNLKFIQYLVENCADSLPDLLDAYSMAGMNSLHYAFKIHIPEALRHGERVRKRLAKKRNLNLKTFLVLLRQFVLRAKPETVAAQDKKDRNTPIHYALSYELCRLESEYYRDKIVRPLVTKGDMVFLKRQHGLQFNRSDESPYLYYQHSEENWRRENGPDAAAAAGAQGKVGTRTQQQQDDAKRSKDSKVDSAPGGARSGEEKKAGKDLPGKGEVAHKDLSLIQDQTLLRKEKQSSAQRGTADRMLDSPQLFTASRGLADKYPSSPVIGKGADLTLPTRHNLAAAAAPQNASLQVGTSTQLKAPKSVGEGSVSGTTAPTTKLDPETAAENIRDFLKLHYIRTRADMEAKELLYGKVASGQCLLATAAAQRCRLPLRLALTHL